jgi:site-specific DNA-cytosine methylase
LTRQISSRDFLKISDAAKLLGVSEQTLRNWDRARKLRPVRHPINGYRMYRVGDLHSILDGLDPIGQQPLFDFDAAPSHDGAEKRTSEDELQPCHWSLAVALDPKHRPQQWKAPSTTVRRDWRKFPQEAHVLDETGTKYRRFTAEEIALLQGFSPAVIADPTLTERQKIGCIGDAVPPPLARALLEAISSVHNWEKRTALEICAGSGGLAEGAASVGLAHLLMVDASDACEIILKNSRSWNPEVVKKADVREVNLAAYRGKVGLFSGGPPCQPWSQSGLRGGQHDPRDLWGSLPDFVGELQPEVFLFENVPGLASDVNRPYFDEIVSRLRNPLPGLKYGVLAAVFNAADFGVPQSRERLFVLGFRGAGGVLASRAFDAVERLQTHQRFGGSRPGLPPWRTVADVLKDREDPGGWRKWISQ